MDETTAAISEALEMLKGWNPSWNPRAWIVDCDQSEITALDTLFPGSALHKTFK